MIYVKDEVVALSELLIDYHNWIAREFGPCSDQEQKLIKLIKEANIGEVSFDRERIASIKYRNYMTTKGSRK